MLLDWYEQNKTVPLPLLIKIFIKCHVKVWIFADGNSSTMTIDAAKIVQEISCAERQCEKREDRLSTRYKHMEMMTHIKNINGEQQLPVSSCKNQKVLKKIEKRIMFKIE